MAVAKKSQLKNTTTNDIIYPESSSQIIFRNDGITTVESSLSNLEAQNNILTQRLAQAQSQIPNWEHW